MRESKRKKKKKRNQNFSLRSTKFCRLEFVRLKMNVHLLNEEFGKSKVSDLGSVHRTS